MFYIFYVVHGIMREYCIVRLRLITRRRRRCGAMVRCRRGTTRTFKLHEVPQTSGHSESEAVASSPFSHSLRLLAHVILGRLP